MVSFAPFLPIDPASVYLKERFDDALEFPHADNAFDLHTYKHDHDFMVLGNDNISGPLSQSSPLLWTPPPSSTPGIHRKA